MRQYMILIMLLGLPGGMMGMGGVVAMRRNDDYSSDYAFDFSDRDIGHPDISDYTVGIVDYNDIGHDYVEREAIEHVDYAHGGDYDYGHGFEYDSGFDYY